MRERTRGGVLVVAGSDPLAYSGLEADFRHLDALGVSGVGVVTVHTEQSVDRLSGTRPVAASTVVAGIAGALQGGGVSAVKIGMLHDDSIVHAVASALAQATVPIVLDPVLVAGGGGKLLDDPGRLALVEDLLPYVRLVTPNLPELAALVPECSDPARGAASLLDRGVDAVLVKGGHGVPAEEVTDLLVTRDGSHTWSSPRLPDPVARGTGCALSVAIAAALAGGQDLVASVVAARAAVREGIASAQDLGTRFLVLRSFREGAFATV